MISIEEKLQVFTQYLLNKERKWGKDIIDQAKNQQENLLEESKLRIKKEKKAIEDRSLHTIFRDRNKIIAEGKNKAKALELEEKNRILIDFNDRILVKAKEFLTKEVYSNYLSDCVEGIPQIFGEKKELIVFVSKRDLNQVKALFKNKLDDYQIEYRDEKKETIGGIIVEDSESRIYCDFTVENLINANYKLIGMTLNDFMENKVTKWQ